MLFLKNYSLIFYINILFSKNSNFVIKKNDKNQKVNTKKKTLFQNPYMH
jgi:hypothetical protein